MEGRLETSAFLMLVMMLKTHRGKEREAVESEGPVEKKELVHFINGDLAHTGEGGKEEN